MLETVYGFINNIKVTATPSEFNPSGIRLKRGADKIIAIIKDALITDGVKPEIMQNKTRNARHIMFLAFSGILKAERSEIRSPHHKDVCKPETANKCEIPLFLKL